MTRRGERGPREEEMIHKVHSANMSGNEARYESALKELGAYVYATRHSEISETDEQAILRAMREEQEELRKHGERFL